MTNLIVFSFLCFIYFLAIINKIMMSIYVHVSTFLIITQSFIMFLESFTRIRSLDQSI